MTQQFCKTVNQEMQRPPVAVRFHLDIDRHSRRKEIKDVAQEGYALPGEAGCEPSAGIERAQVFPRQ